jgi:hypothetical protein
VALVVAHAEPARDGGRQPADAVGVAARRGAAAVERPGDREQRVAQRVLAVVVRAGQLGRTLDEVLDGVSSSPSRSAAAASSSSVPRRSPTSAVSRSARTTRSSPARLP